jgi:hypothetical protein
VSWPGKGVSLCVALALTATACNTETTPNRPLLTGSSGSSNTAGSANHAGATPGPTPEGFLPEGAPRSAPLRRLTRSEYRNLVRDVLEIDPPPEYALPEDWTNAGFRSTADELTTVAAATRYLDAALDIGERLLPTIHDLMPCSASDLAGELACIDGWLTSFGPRLFRRPMTDEEHARFLAAFEQARASETYEQSASLVVEAVLVAPELLFIELPSGGKPGDVLPLDSWQVAARLSLLLWDSTPDEALLAAAERGELTSRAALAKQVGRMLEDARTHATVRSFFDDWLGLAKIPGLAADPESYPYLPRELAAELAEETRAYSEDVFQQRDFRELFVSGRRFRSAALSGYYGDQLSQEEGVIAHDAEISQQSFGLLSQAGFLMTLAHAEPSSPIHRGAFVRRKLLCGRLPSAPPGVLVPLPELTTGVSKRQNITEHTAGAACVGCHGAFNDLGFALEHFDIAGTWRDSQGKLAIDTHVSFDEPGLRADVDGALQLSQALANSPSARACAVQQLFTFALERIPTSAEQAWFDQLGRSFESSGFSMKALLTELVLSDEFRSRIEPGAPP